MDVLELISVPGKLSALLLRCHAATSFNSKHRVPAYSVSGRSNSLRGTCACYYTDSD